MHLYSKVFSLSMSILAFQYIGLAYLFFSGLLLQRKLNNSLFNIFKKFSGVGIVKK